MSVSLTCAGAQLFPFGLWVNESIWDWPELIPDWSARRDCMARGEVAVTSPLHTSPLHSLWLSFLISLCLPRRSFLSIFSASPLTAARLPFGSTYFWQLDRSALEHFTQWYPFTARSAHNDFKLSVMVCNGHFNPTIEGISVQGSLYRRGAVGLTVYTRFKFIRHCIFFIGICSTLMSKSTKSKTRVLPNMLTKYESAVFFSCFFLFIFSLVEHYFIFACFSSSLFRFWVQLKVILPCEHHT